MVSESASLDKVKSILGLGSLNDDLEGLRTFYRAWCLNVPFDNLAKTKSLFGGAGAKPPYLDETAFFSNFLSARIGGTCWPHANAIYALAKACGFDAYRATASMFAVGPANHGTTLVKLPDGTTWLLDNAFLNIEPLRIDPEAPSFFDDPVHYAEVELDGDEVYIHAAIPPFPHIFFKLLDRDVPASTYKRQWDELCLMGPFNAGVHMLKNHPDKTVLLRGSTLHTLDKSGIQRRSLNPEEIKATLRDTMGVAPQFIEQWAASGAVEASLQPEKEMPDLPKRVPPSKK